MGAKQQKLYTDASAQFTDFNDGLYSLFHRLNNHKLIRPVEIVAACKNIGCRQAQKKLQILAISGQVDFLKQEGLANTSPFFITSLMLLDGRLLFRRNTRYGSLFWGRSRYAHLLVSRQSLRLVCK